MELPWKEGRATIGHGCGGSNRRLVPSVCPSCPPETSCSQTAAPRSHMASISSTDNHRQAFHSTYSSVESQWTGRLHWCKLGQRNHGPIPHGRDHTSLHLSRKNKRTPLPIKSLLVVPCGTHWHTVLKATPTVHRGSIHLIASFVSVN